MTRIKMSSIKVDDLYYVIDHNYSCLARCVWADDKILSLDNPQRSIQGRIIQDNGYSKMVNNRLGTTTDSTFHNATVGDGAEFYKLSIEQDPEYFL